MSKPATSTGEWFNLTPEQRTLIVERLNRASPNQITLVYGFPKYEKNHKIPHDVAAGEDPTGEVYAFWPVFAQLDVDRLEALEANGVGAPLNLSQRDHDLVRNLLRLKKIGSTVDTDDRFSNLAYPNPITDEFRFEKAESVDCRHDERLCHSALYNNGQGYPQPHYPGRNLGVPPAPYVSGEWVRCTQNEAEAVRTSTHSRNPLLGETPGGTHNRDGGLSFPVSLNDVHRWKASGLVEQFDLEVAVRYDLIPIDGIDSDSDSD